MYGVLSCGGGLVALAAGQDVPPLDPLDLLLLDNFVAAHASFRLVRPLKTLLMDRSETRAWKILLQLMHLLV